jgi:hypothetical protein
MVDEHVARALGTLLVDEIARLPELLAVAISYETAQATPALYLAHETLAHCMQGLRTELSNDKVTAFEAPVSG